MTFLDCLDMQPEPLPSQHRAVHRFAEVGDGPNPRFIPSRTGADEDSALGFTAPARLAESD